MVNVYKENKFKIVYNIHKIQIIVYHVNNIICIIYKIMNVNIFIKEYLFVFNIMIIKYVLNVKLVNI